MNFKFENFKLQISNMIFDVMFMDLSNFQRVNGMFDFTFKIQAQQNFKKTY